MQAHECVYNIMSRIKKNWDKYKDILEPEITFNNYKNVCLIHLDIASSEDIQNYHIGDVAVFIEKKITDFKITELKNKIRKLEDEKKCIKSILMEKTTHCRVCSNIYRVIL